MQLIRSCITRTRGSPKKWLGERFTFSLRIPFADDTQGSNERHFHSSYRLISKYRSRIYIEPKLGRHPACVCHKGAAINTQQQQYLSQFRYCSLKFLLLAMISRHRLLTVLTLDNHDVIIKWKHFPRYRPFVQGIHRSPELWCFLWSPPE